MPNVDRPGPEGYLRASVPILFWSGVIFFFSSLPGQTFPEVTSLGSLLWRKAAHVGEFFVLTLLSYRLFRLRFRENAIAILFAALLALAYACSDEFHQTFVPGREGKLPDVAIDAIGILLASVVLAVLARRRK